MFINLIYWDNLYLRLEKRRLNINLRILQWERMKPRRISIRFYRLLLETESICWNSLSILLRIRNWLMKSQNVLLNKCWRMLVFLLRKNLGRCWLDLLRRKVLWIINFYWRVIRIGLRRLMLILFGLWDLRSNDEL